MNTTLSIAQIKDQMEAYFDNQGFDLSPKELYEPLDYILSIGGKRFRPSALIAACQMFSDKIQQALPAAYAIELFHNFSLIHDDIMDAAPLRRGHDTVHSKWDTNTAILSGDAMLIYSFRYLNKSTTSENCQLIHDVFTEVSIKVCEGQQMDVNFENRLKVPIPEYIEMIYKKTGALVEGAMEIGALIGGATLAQSKALGQFAKKMGISFQLQDDILDAYGTKAKVGKQTGGDIIQNKKTILYLLTLESANDSDSSKLKDLFTSESTSTGKIQKVMSIFDKYDARSKAESLRDQYHAEAMDAMETLDIDEVSKRPVKALFENLLRRQY